MPFGFWDIYHQTCLGTIDGSLVRAELSWILCTAKMQNRTDYSQQWHNPTTPQSLQNNEQMIHTQKPLHWVFYILFHLVFEDYLGLNRHVG